eukprot:1154541-Pelagomonas_calceolata.AAC.1
MPNVIFWADGAISPCETEALGYKDQAKTGGRMPLWHLPNPILRNGGSCSPSFSRLSSRLPAHSVRSHAEYLLKRCFPSSRKASSLTFSAGPLHLARHPACFYLYHYSSEIRASLGRCVRSISMYRV